jgi:hypothetical protein
MDQIASLRAPRNLIGFAGSALHTLIPAGDGHMREEKALCCVATFRPV